MGERKSITCIYREKINLNEQTLRHQHKPVGEAEAQRHLSFRTPPRRHHNTPI